MRDYLVSTIDIRCHSTGQPPELRSKGGPHKREHEGNKKSGENGSHDISLYSLSSLFSLFSQVEMVLAQIAY